MPLMQEFDDFADVSLSKNSIHSTTDSSSSDPCEEHINQNTPKETNDTSLIDAVKRNSPEDVVTILKKGFISTNDTDRFGNAALHFAVAEKINSVLIVGELLDHGANLNQVNKHGQTPLAVCILTFKQHSKNGMLDYLLQNGANPNARISNNGATVLHESLRKKMYYTAQQLLLAGADLNARDASGVMPCDLVQDDKILKTLHHCIRKQPSFLPTPSLGECMRCKKEFTWRRKATNCEHCGRVVCSSCANKTLDISELPPYFFNSHNPVNPKNFGIKTHKSSKLSDVCQTCYHIVQSRQKDTTGRHNLLHRILRPGLKLVQ